MFISFGEVGNFPKAKLQEVRRQAVGVAKHFLSCFRTFVFKRGAFHGKISRLYRLLYNNIIFA
jgi:hypothetical protein